MAFDNFVLITNWLSGSAIVNYTTGKVTMFENEFITNQRDISHPSSSTINLISGKTFGKDSTTLIAFDQMAKEIWNSPIKILDDLRSNVNPIQIFRTGKYFIVRNSGQVLALEAGSGKRIWDKPFPPFTTEAMLWNQNLLLYTLNDPVIMGENEQQYMNIKLIAPENGNVIWSKDFKTIGDVGIAPGNNNLIIYSDNRLTVLNEKGALKLDTTNENNKAYVKTKMDELTGKNYLLYNGEVLYW